MTINYMMPLKSPGPDGMLPLFYQSYWSLVGTDVTKAILLYLNSGTLPPILRHSYITLIPKVKNPEYVSQYCPISLSNVLYRVFSKVLANGSKRFYHILFLNIKAPSCPNAWFQTILWCLSKPYTTWENIAQATWAIWL